MVTDLHDALLARLPVSGAVLPSLQLRGAIMAKLQNMRGLQVPTVCLMPCNSLRHPGQPDKTIGITQ